MGCILSKKKSSSSPLSNGSFSAVKAPDPIKPMKPVTEPIEEAKLKPKSENLHQEEEVLVIKHRKSHERSKKTDSDKDSPASPVVEKSNVRISSCTKEEVDAILIQCGKLSRNNSAAKTRRYSGSKRSFDFDQNERIRGGDMEEEEEEIHRNRHRGVERVNGSPRERRRRTPSRERENRSGSRERGNGGGSRRVSRSPAKRSEINSNSCGSSVNSSNNRPGKFVTIPATDKSNNNAEPLVKRMTVKRNIGDACRIAASPRSKSPAIGTNNVSSLSRSNSRKAEQSPYRRNPLGEIDQNSSKVGSCNNIKKTITRTIRATSPAIVEKPVLSRSRSLRKSRDFDLVSNEENNYTALLLKDIQNFHGKSVVVVDDDDDNSISLPLCVTKACSIVEAVADLNSTSNTCLSSDLNSSQFRFTSTVKKADLMEPSFEKYVTVKRGGSLEESSAKRGICLPPVGWSFAPLYPWVLWNLWTARNQEIFAGRRFTSEEVVSKATSEARGWQQAQADQKSPSSPLLNPRLPRQQPNPRRSILCRIDASWV